MPGQDQRRVGYFYPVVMGQFCADLHPLEPVILTRLYHCRGEAVR